MSISFMARGGLVGEAFADVIAGRQLSHSGCGEGGGGQNRRWPTSGQGGYINPVTWGVPTASKWGAESEVAHKWAT